MIVPGRPPSIDDHGLSFGQRTALAAALAGPLVQDERGRWHAADGSRHRDPIVQSLACHTFFIVTLKAPRKAFLTTAGRPVARLAADELERVRAA